MDLGSSKYHPLSTTKSVTIIVPYSMLMDNVNAYKVFIDLSLNSMNTFLLIPICSEGVPNLLKEVRNNMLVELSKLIKFLFTS